MKVLLIFPKYPDSFWSFKHAMRFIPEKALVPPLGLITVSAMLPETWQKKLVDMNVSALLTQDILWADYVFISATNIQKESVNKVMEACGRHHTKIVAGGPLFTTEYENYPQIDHFVLNEAEITLPYFLNDLDEGRIPERVYKTEEFADLTLSPTPDYHLLSLKDYVSMNVQVSRGCPFACDFCEITSLLGHKVRMKQTRQVIKELDLLYHLNWRGRVFIVDDNFIGNKHYVRNSLLPAMRTWMTDHKYPFVFMIQCSVNLADDEELMTLLTQAGFNATFVGIETPSEESLQNCNKTQNKNRDLLQCVKKIQRAGLSVAAGFIVGFDSDTPSVFQQQIDFIQKSGIVTAMVGLLNAPKNTLLYKRLKEENRLKNEISGNNTDSTLNFIPKMNDQELIDGYKRIIQSIYSIKPYYQRIRQFMIDYKSHSYGRKNLRFSMIGGIIKSFLIIGILNKGRIEFWKLLVWTVFRRPRMFIDALTLAVYGYHYRIVYGLRQ